MKTTKVLLGVALVLSACGKNEAGLESTDGGIALARQISKKVKAVDCVLTTEPELAIPDPYNPGKKYSGRVIITVKQGYDTERCAENILAKYSDELDVSPYNYHRDNLVAGLKSETSKIPDESYPTGPVTAGFERAKKIAKALKGLDCLTGKGFENVYTLPGTTGVDPFSGRVTGHLKDGYDAGKCKAQIKRKLPGVDVEVQKLDALRMTMFYVG